MIVEYHDTGQVIEVDPVVDMLFEAMRINFDIDREKYERKCESNAENWKLWWRPKKKSEWNPKNPDGFSENPKKPKKPKEEEKEEEEENENENISTIVDKEQALDFPESYGKKEINEALSFLSHTIGIDEFKEPVAKQRQYANHIVNLSEKVGKAEFIERLKGVLSDSFKKKNCNSIAYLYRELKSFIHEEKSLVPTEKKVINSIWVL